MNGSFLIRFLALFAAVFAVLFMAVWFYLSVTQPAEAGGPLDSPAAARSMDFATDDLTIRTVAGRTHDFRIEIAETSAQKRLGLMHRDQLAGNAGMLFVYEPPRRVAMWMKNTRIGLDMLFAKTDGTVFYIHENARPHDETLISAPTSAPTATAYVLELKGGTVARLGLGVGDTLVSDALLDDALAR